jgi:hypothetical protein
MALRKIFVSNSEKVTGEWRKLLEKELLGLYCSPDILRLIASHGRDVWYVWKRK